MLLPRSVAVSLVTVPVAAVAFWVVWDWTYTDPNSPMVVEDVSWAMQLLTSVGVGLLAGLVVGSLHKLWVKSGFPSARWGSDRDE